jgi:hypothetical protein
MVAECSPSTAGAAGTVSTGASAQPIAMEMTVASSKVLMA